MQQVLENMQYDLTHTPQMSLVERPKTTTSLPVVKTDSAPGAPAIKTMSDTPGTATPVRHARPYIVRTTIERAGSQSIARWQVYILILLFMNFILSVVIFTIKNKGL